MTMTKIINNGNSQITRKPAELASERSDLEIERIGDETRIRTTSRRLNQVLAKFAQFAPGFMPQGRDTDKQFDRKTL